MSIIKLLVNVRLNKRKIVLPSLMMFSLFQRYFELKHRRLGLHFAKYIWNSSAS